MQRIRFGSALFARSAMIAIGGCLLATLATAASGEAVGMAGTTGKKDLIIADHAKTEATVVVSPTPGEWEAQACTDLVHYVEMMTGAKLTVANTPETIAAALKVKTPVLLLGEEALKAESGLRKDLAKVAKKDPVLRADAIVLKRDGNRIYVAGNHDEAHYYALAELLRRWGCRWYSQTEFGECIPTLDKLVVGQLDYAYGSPFEIRCYWISWIGEYNGRREFMRRNMMNEIGVPCGHCLGQYVKDIAPGGNIFKVPVSDPATAEHVAKQLAPKFAKGEEIMLGMEDGTYQPDYPKDKELMALQYDKYFMMPAMTDAFMEFYNNVARILLKQYPDSKSKIGYLAYSNITLPPVRKITAEKPLVAYLAPIDIDPIHGMDDPNSPPQQEYKDMLYKWAKVMEGRLAIYDYDQGMLVWRDLPEPSVQHVRQEIQHYRKAGILGVDTESRMAFATTFLNLYLRGRLYWNPDENVEALLAEFYPSFYGVAAEPMAAYWNAINKAWAETIVTEHEYFVAPAIYTPELVASLKKNLEAAEALAAPLAGKANATRQERQVVARMKFTRLSFDVLQNYMAMVQAAAGNVDYRAAIHSGEFALATRDQLTAMNKIFTTTQLEGGSPAWFVGEVQQYRDLLQYTEGTNGTLLVKLPLEWAFRRDPADAGVKENWLAKPADLTYWNDQGKKMTLDARKDYPTNQWEMLRTDLYIQAQGVRHPDRQSYTGYGWYRTDVDLKADQIAGKVHIHFPGIFNDCWVYLNGQQVGERKFASPLWWLTDYRFEMDVDLAGKLKPGTNTIAVRFYNPHHLGGMFRRPFLYTATK